MNSRRFHKKIQNIHKFDAFFIFLMHIGVVFALQALCVIV